MAEEGECIYIYILSHSSLFQERAKEKRGRGANSPKSIYMLTGDYLFESTFYDWSTCCGYMLTLKC